MKVSTPVEASTLNSAASDPPALEYDSALPDSASIAVVVVTPKMFSAMLTEAASPPPLLVILGAALGVIERPSFKPFWR